MPSRHKKVLRDSMLTNSFFNQAGSSGCSCCPGHSHGPATASSKPGDSDDNKSAAVGSGEDHSKYSVIKTNYRTVDRSLSSVMVSYWKEKYNSLTPEEVKKLHAAIDAKKTVSDPKAAMVALKLAHKQMKDVPATADPYPPIENFDLSDLDEVAKKYDKFCKMYQDDEERGIASLAGLIGDLAVTASDVERSPEDRLAAELDIQNLNIYSKVIVPLNSCLRQVQVFNIEKRFGFVEESYHALCDEDQRWRREDVPAETPLSYRQKWNNPFNLTASAPKPRKKKEKKALSGIEALVKLQRNCKLAIEGMKDLKQTTNDAEKPIELASVPGSSTYADVPIPEDIPDHVRQRFFDAELAFQEVLNLQEEASKLLLRVRGTFVVWYSTGDEEWYVCFVAIPSCSVLRPEAYESFSAWEARFAF